MQPALEKLHVAPRRLFGPGMRQLAFVVLVAFAAYKSAQYVIDDDLTGLAIVGGALAGIFAVVKMLGHWRVGFYFFLTWLTFEDFFRKYLGNATAAFFIKDVLLAVVYFSFFIAYRRKEVRFFRPVFLLPVVLLVWLGIAQIFNPASPSVLFGLLGFKLYFLYIPLIFVGYELITSEEGLRRFFYINSILALLVCGLGIAQSVIGPTFLSPATLSEDLRGVGNLYHVAPISGVHVFRASSVFVSPGRYGDYVVISWLLILGLSGYLLLRPHRGRNLAFVALAVNAAAIVLAGSRGPFMWGLGSLILTWIAFVWGARRGRGGASQMMRAFQRSVIGVVVAMTFLFMVFPDALSSRLTLYTETLSPTSSAGTELTERSWYYPIRNFLAAFDYDRWPYGYGIGTVSLGTQYIRKIIHVSPLNIGVESGFGSIVLEMGIVGIILWLIMSVSISVAAWREVKKLKGSPYFPIGFVIFLYAVLLLLPMTFTSIAGYQDFIVNAYLWLMLGILFRLRSIEVSVGGASGDVRA
ncbi:MAG: hypothetical protein NVS9B4_06870 [Candidatus Acidiferrum sp.]